MLGQPLPDLPAHPAAVGFVQDPVIARPVAKRPHGKHRPLRQLMPRIIRRLHLQMMIPPARGPVREQPRRTVLKTHALWQKWHRALCPA